MEDLSLNYKLKFNQEFKKQNYMDSSNINKSRMLMLVKSSKETIADKIHRSNSLPLNVNNQKKLCFRTVGSEKHG